MKSNSARVDSGRRGDPHAASTPELLLSGIVPELLGNECRPRSWSTQGEAGLERRPPNRFYGASSATCGSPVRSSTFSVMSQPAGTPPRSSSIYSKSGGIAVGVSGSPDSQLSRAQPRVATTSAGGSHPVMARGQIIAPQVRPRPLSSSGMRKQALSLMKSLVALGAQQQDTPPTSPSPAAVVAVIEPVKDALSVSPAESATDSVTVAGGSVGKAVDSASSHRTDTSSRRGSCQSMTASDTDAAASLLKNPRQRQGSKTGALVGVRPASDEQLLCIDGSKVTKPTHGIATESLDQQLQQHELPKQ
ncbi:hypothetical protein GGI18_003159, partial [Coemansia linderi]